MKTKVILSIALLTAGLHAADGGMPQNPAAGALEGVHHGTSPRVGSPVDEMLQSAAVVSTDGIDAQIAALREQLGQMEGGLSGMIAKIVTSQLAGMQGPAGANGKDGAPGVEGPAGANGKDGEPGVPGAEGLQGPAGVDGKDGEPGVQGPQGPAGVNGKDGATAEELLVAALGNEDFMQGLTTSVAAALLVDGSPHRTALGNLGADVYEERKATRKAARGLWWNRKSSTADDGADAGEGSALSRKRGSRRGSRKKKGDDAQVDGAPTLDAGTGDGTKD